MASNKEKEIMTTDEEIKEEKVSEEEVKEEDTAEDTIEESVDYIGDENEEKEEKKEEKKEETPEEKLKRELDEQKDRYLRLCAEYDNYRKRTQNEKAGIYDDATKRAVTEILPIADSMMMALSTLEGTDVPKEYKKGIELIADQLKKSFEKLDIKEFGEVGDKFDPALYNAVSKIEDENFEENSISAVYQKGFKLRDKIVRHAMVQVANCD